MTSISSNATLRRSFLATAVLAASLTSGPAMADIAYAVIESSNVPLIHVESNNNQYTNVSNSSQNITGTMRVEVDGEVNGRVKSFEAFPMLGYLIDQLHFSWDHFKDSGYSKSYSTPRPKEDTVVFDFQIPRSDYADFMVAACNNHADRLRSQGKKNSEIFDKNRTLAIGLEGYVIAEFTGPDRLNPPPTEVGKAYTIGISCRRDGSLDPVTTAISGAYLHVKPMQKLAAEGVCELELAGSLISAEPNTQVKFIYIDDKGKQSDLKTVTTDGDGQITFKHQYPTGSGPKSGKIRMVGQSHAFFSNWSSYESNCTPLPGDIATVLPPKATHLEAIATAENVMHRGLICPAKVKIWGIIEGRGEVTGNVALAVGGKLNALEPYSIKDGQTVVTQGEHELKWDNHQSAQQNVQYAMYVLNKNGDQVDQMQVSQNFVCKEPQVSGAVQGGAQGYASNDNLPKSVTLSLSTQGQKKIPGYVCPEKVRLHGNVMSDDQPLQGAAALYVSGSLVAEHDVDLQANWGHNYDAEHTFVWNAATQTEQTMNFTLKFANQHGHIVKTVEKSESFACQKVSVNPSVAGGPGGIATEQNNPLPAQQQRPQAATGQIAVAPALAVMAPKGTVRNGEIRLSGAKPNAAYKLTFLRRSGTGYTAVNAAQLPKQMKGPNASFPLAALSGGRAWRLQVCPVGAAPSACETSDFRVALIGAKTDGQSGGGEPGGIQPTTSFIVVPGLAN